MADSFLSRVCMNINEITIKSVTELSRGVALHISRRFQIAKLRLDEPYVGGF